VDALADPAAMATAGFQKLTRFLLAFGFDKPPLGARRPVYLPSSRV
jgi:hypothetical protein